MTEQDKQERDDQQWLELLAGRDVANADDATRKEAQAIRKTILQSQQQKLDDVTIKRAEKKLINRLKAENLIKAKPSVFKPFSLVAIAASVAMVAITLNIVINLQSIPSVSDDFSRYPVYRSDNNQQIIRAVNTEQLAEEIKQQLHKLKVPYRFTETNSVWLVEIYVGNNRQSELLQLIAKYNLSIDEHGWVKVNILQKQN